MKGFSLKNWIMKYYTIFSNLYEHNVDFLLDRVKESEEKFKNDDDMSYEDIACIDVDNLSQEEIQRLKQKYIELHNKEAACPYPLGVVAEEDDIMDAYDLDHTVSWGIATEDRIRGLIGIVIAGEKSKNPDYREKAEAANSYLKGIVAEGYDIYPIMKDMINAKKQQEMDLKEENSKPYIVENGVVVSPGPDAELVDILRSRVADNSRGIKLFEDYEKLSPYWEVFEISDQIGKLKMLEKKAESDTSLNPEIIAQQIELLQNKLVSVVSQFDPVFLQQVSKNRLDYLIASGQKELMNYHVNGASAIRTAIGKSQTQQKQAQNENMIK